MQTRDSKSQKKDPPKKKDVTEKVIEAAEVTGKYKELKRMMETRGERGGGRY